MTDPLLTLRDAFARSFPAGRDWAAEALARLGRAPDDDRPVQAVAQGWMRLGGERDALLVDTLFVLTDDELGFGQTHIHTSDPNWVPLSTIVAIDLIEGVPYPLEAIEVQFAGGLAIFVGWPEDFSQAVLDSLLGPVDEQVTIDEPETDEIARDEIARDETAADEVATDESTLDAMSGAAVIEGAVVDGVIPEDLEPELVAVEVDDLELDDTDPDVVADADDTPFARTGIAASVVMPPLFAALETSHGLDPAIDDIDDIDEDVVADPAPALLDPPLPPASPLSRLTAPTTPFAPDDAPGSFIDDDESSEAEDRFFADLEHSDEAEDAPALFSVTAPAEDEDLPEVPEDVRRERGPWDDPAMPWPDPYKNCVFLGGHPVHQRRRKNVVVVMRAGGLVIAAAGSNGWSIHVPWQEVRRIDVQGADEVKFTHNHRIDLNGSALVIEQTDGTSLIVEVRNRRPATVRSGLAPVIAMANMMGPGGSSGADLSSF